MSESETIGAEVEEIIGEALEIHSTPSPPAPLFRTDDPVEVVQKATEVANALAAVVESKQLYKAIGQKKHVLVEGWTLLGSMLGVFASIEWTRQITEGWEARAVARTMAGVEIGAAEAICTRRENKWSKADDYAIKSMAQTRAVSKALRAPLGFIMTLAGYEPTPEAEMPEAEPVRSESPEMLRVPKSWAAITEMVSAYDELTYELFLLFADACRRYLYPGSTDTKSLERSERAEMLRVVGIAALRLREQVDASKFPPPGIEDIQRAFASVLEGQELAPSEHALEDWREKVTAAAVAAAAQREGAD